MFFSKEEEECGTTRGLRYDDSLENTMSFALRAGADELQNVKGYQREIETSFLHLLCSKGRESPTIESLTTLHPIPIRR